MFKGYQTGSFFDEMYGCDQVECFQHYKFLENRFNGMEEAELGDKQRSLENGFLEQGVTFTVYGDNKGTERIFPFDLILISKLARIELVARLYALLLVPALIDL